MLNDAIASLFNSCLAHKYLPSSVMKVILVPILKKQNLDSKIIKNYRPIALASILSKVFEKLIYNRYETELGTHPGQFGYKKSVGCETAIFTLKQIAHHYMRKGSCVYLCYLDASRAFDTVNHTLLLNKLCDRGMDSECIGLLEHWFQHQLFQCRWKSHLSSPFSVRSGVRQGGINSAYYFAVYMDRMWMELESSGVGCRAGSQMCNFIAYADDYVLLTTTISAMNQLLKICETYAAAHNISFNASKTYLQAFIPQEMNNSRPLIKLCGQTIKWVDSVKYLGWDRDREELLHRKHDIYAQANMIRAKFGSCNSSVKKYLFSTYFSSFFCMSLWNPVKAKNLDAVRVAYNNSFRIIFQYAFDCSASSMFSENNMCDFETIRVRSIVSLLSRLSTSSNPILYNIFNSNILMNSSLYRSWHDLLLKYLW